MNIKGEEQTQTEAEQGASALRDTLQATTAHSGAGRHPVATRERPNRAQHVTVMHQPEVVNIYNCVYSPDHANPTATHAPNRGEGQTADRPHTAPAGNHSVDKGPTR